MNNSDFDKKIRRALAEDENKIDYRSAADQGIIEMMMGIYRGKLMWLNVLGSIFQLLFMALAVWSAFRFFDATEIRNQILYSTLFLWGVGVTAMFKMWFWMVMNRNSLIREVKRLELQIAQLRQD